MNHLMGWSPSLNEYEKMVIHMNNPRLEIDNVVCPTATLVKVDSVRKLGIHLEAIQVLADLNLNIRKAYISSDGRWCLDVFHVTDLNGNKLADDKVINYLEQSFNVEPSFDSDEDQCMEDPLTCLELTGTDRLGLLSEISAVISDLHCDIVNSFVWTHVGRMVALVFIKYADFKRIQLITARLKNLLNRDHDVKGAKVHVAEKEVVNVDRRLHQMMFEDCDYDVESKEDYSDCCLKSYGDVSVTIENWIERGYSVVTVQCKDRPKLLFDVVFTLSDMKYAVPHGSVDTKDDRANLEFYVKHLDGTMITLEAERNQLINCLRAAVERRSNEGLKLELCTMDKPGLLAKVTRTFREYGLSIARAEISTSDSVVKNTFYVTDASGLTVSSKTAEDVIEKIGSDKIKKAEENLQKVAKRPVRERSVVGLHYFGNVVKSSLNLLGLVRSCS